MGTAKLKLVHRFYYYYHYDYDADDNDDDDDDDNDDAVNAGANRRQVFFSL